jgi:hypothetical protein
MGQIKASHKRVTLSGNTDDMTYFVTVGGGFQATGLDDREARRILLDNNVPGTKCDEMFYQVDLGRAIKTGADCVVYDYATDIPKSEPLPYKEAKRAHALLMAAHGDDGSIRVAPWGDDLPGWTEEDDSPEGRAQMAMRRRKRYPETYA